MRSLRTSLLKDFLTSASPIQINWLDAKNKNNEPIVKFICLWQWLWSYRILTSTLSRLPSFSLATSLNLVGVILLAGISMRYRAKFWPSASTTPFSQAPRILKANHTYCTIINWHHLYARISCSIQNSITSIVCKKCNTLVTEWWTHLFARLQIN